MSNTLIIFGVILIIIGLVGRFLPEIKIPLLPGDIFIQKENFTFYFPLVTSVIISIFLTIIINIFR